MLSCRHTSDARPLRPLILQLVESQLDSWMAEFHTLLTYENAALDEADAEKESSLDAVKSAACQVRRASAAARHVCGVGGHGCAILARCTSCLVAPRRMDLAFTRFAAPCLTPCTWSGTSSAPDVFTRWPCIPPHTHMSQNINLFMETSEEEFAKYLQTFVADVWGLLMKVSLKPGQVRGSRGCAPEGAPPSLKRSSNCEGQSSHGHIRQFGTRACDDMSVSAPCAHTHCCCCSRTTS